MSNAIFPVFPGQSPEITKTPQWSTRVQRSVSGVETRTALYSLPIWKFSLSYEVLRAGTYSEIQELIGFFNARQGSFDTFLFDDTTDNTVTGQSFSAADGSTTDFQLVRTMGAASEPIGAVKGTPVIYIDGVATTDFTLSQYTGSITFATAPAAGALLTWDGNFYFRCRFSDDEMDFETFMRNLWQAEKVEFVSVKS